MIKAARFILGTAYLGFVLTAVSAPTKFIDISGPRDPQDFRLEFRSSKWEGPKITLNQKEDFTTYSYDRSKGDYVYATSWRYIPVALEYLRNDFSYFKYEDVGAWDKIILLNRQLLAAAENQCKVIVSAGGATKANPPHRNPEDIFASDHEPWSLTSEDISLRTVGCPADGEVAFADLDIAMDRVTIQKIKTNSFYRKSGVELTRFGDITAADIGGGYEGEIIALLYDGRVIARSEFFTEQREEQLAQQFESISRQLAYLRQRTLERRAAEGNAPLIRYSLGQIGRKTIESAYPTWGEIRISFKN